MDLDNTHCLRRTVASLERLIPELMGEAGIPGLGIAVVEDGAIVWQHGYGIKDTLSREPVETNTVFEAGSLSKPVFAYGVLKLCEENFLSLDDYVGKYYPIPYTEDGFNPTDPYLKYITVRQILSHSAGFGNWGTKEVGKINFFPGERFFYAGEGYVYLQRVIEYLLNQPLAQYMLSSVLYPLGMHESSFIWEERYQPLFAQGHGYRAEAIGHKWSKAISAYSLYSTVTDLAILLVEMMKRGSGNANRLSDHSINEMISPQIKIDAHLYWGLGWGIERTAQDHYFWHWGDLGDYTCFAMASRGRRKGVVIMTNSEKGLGIFQRIVQEVLDEKYTCFTRFL